MSADTSRAVRLDSFGGPEVLQIRHVPAPQAGPGQIRVPIAASFPAGQIRPAAELQASRHVKGKVVIDL